jgi:hypothetical protein
MNFAARSDRLREPAPLKPSHEALLDLLLCECPFGISALDSAPHLFEDVQVGLDVFQLAVVRTLLGKLANFLLEFAH